jgi:murein DD-endopeptidase MepM/ murein hydrolase activator NlpD
MVGWLVNNLPTIIRLGEQLIDRGGKLFGVLRSFIGNVTSILSGFGSLLSGTFSNLIGFDFSNQRQLIDNTLSTIQTGMIGIENDINSAITLLTTPLDLGFGQLDFDKGGPPPGSPPGAPTPSGPSGGGKLQSIHKQALDIISGPESGGNYNAMNQGTDARTGKIVGSGDSSEIIGKPLTRMTIGEVMDRQDESKYPRNARPDRGIHAAGRYQIIGSTMKVALKESGLSRSDIFDEKNQDLLAIAVLKSQGPGAWTKYSKYTKKEIEIMYKAKETPLGQPAPATPSPVSPLSGSRVVDSVNIAAGGNKIVKLTPGQGFGAYRTPTRSHAGIDINTSGQRGWLVGFKKSGTVTYAKFSGESSKEGYGNLVIIKSGNTEYYFAHLAKIMVKLGPYNGEVIGEIGTTGGSTGIHLHYEVRPNGRPINPEPYLNLLSIDRETAASQTAAKPATATGIQVASVKPTSTSELKLDRTGNGGPIIFLPPIQVAQALPPAQSSKGGSGLSAQSSDTSGLNNIRLRQLNFFA